MTESPTPTEVRLDHRGDGRSTLILRPEGEYVEVHTFGLVSPETGRDQHRAMTQMPGWTPRFSRLVIWERGARLGEMDPEVLDQSAKDARAFYAERPEALKTRSAHVIRDEHNMPLLAYWRHLATAKVGFDIRLFSDVETAKAWLTEPAWLKRQ